MITSIDQMPSVKPVPKFTEGMSGWGKFKAWFSRREWMLMEDPYWFYKLPDGVWIRFPSGFVFDFASVPRPFHPFLNPTGLLLIASIPHDFIYRHGYLETTSGTRVRYNRKQADLLLKAITVHETHVRTGSIIAYEAVRIGGSGSWAGR